MWGPLCEIIGTKGQASKHGYIHNTFWITKKKKTSIALGFLSIDLIQKEGVNYNYSSWKINCGAISYLMNFWPKFTCLIKISVYLITPYIKGDQNRQWKVLTQSERVKTNVD